MVAASPELYEQVLVARGRARGRRADAGHSAGRRDEGEHICLTHATPGVNCRRWSPVAQGAAPSAGVAADCAGQGPGGLHRRDRSGDSVMLISPQGELTPLGVIPKYVRFRLAGTYHIGLLPVRLADGLYAAGRCAAAFRRARSAVGDQLQGGRPEPRAGDWHRQIEQAAGKGFMTTNWMEQNRELFRALRLEQVVTFIVIALIVIVAALNILIALTMMVMEKTRDIAVMMSFGVEPEQVRRIFLMQGLLISVIGTAIGLVLGYVASWAGGHYHFIHLSAEVYSIDTLPFAPRAVGWRDCGGGFDRDLAAGDAVSVASGGARAAGRGAAVRVS